MEDENHVTLHPRKRQKKLENRKRTIAKKNVECGNEHKTSSGRIIAAKKFESQIICKCGKGCCQKIDVLRQKEIFDNFYKTSNWTQKTLLIRGTVKKLPVPPKFDPIIPQNVRQNFQYTLENADGVSCKVCRDFYIKCLNLTPSRTERALKSVIKNPSASETRGRGPPANKTSEQDRSKVINFINLFPKYESHYSRKKSSKKFLHPNLNLNKLFDEYKNSCEFKKENPVSHYVFSEIFNNNFNLGFKRCHTDTCKTCDNFQCSLKASGVQEEIAEIKRKQLKHMELVEYVHKEFKQDVTNAERNGTSIVLTFDLQKTLETPALTTSVAYYKRQLWTYNLCIYDEINKKGYMYVWNESIASRGGQEIGSCLINHLKKYVPSSADNVVLYSDSCGGQNRNIKLALLLKHFLASSHLKSITQKYFISGHSYNSCDRCFSLIEKYKKKIEIVATPNDWINIIKEAKKSEPKFIVIEMNTPDFITSKELERLIVNRKIDINGQKINWYTIRRIIQEKSNVFQLTLFDGNVTQVVSLAKRGVREEDFEMLELACLYPEGKAITKSKYLDLQQLMCFIPVECRTFFENLNYENKEDIDYGFVCDGSDPETA